MLLALACAVVLQAQSWDALRGLRPGEKIKVDVAPHEEFQGAFQSASERDISLQTRRSPVSVERARVRRVRLRAPAHRVRNVLIGAGIGLAVGLVVDRTAGTYARNEVGENSAARALTYVVPIAVFAGIGAALPAYRTIYRAP